MKLMDKNVTGNKFLSTASGLAGSDLLYSHGTTFRRIRPKASATSSNSSRKHSMAFWASHTPFIDFPSGRQLRSDIEQRFVNFKKFLKPQ